MKNLCVGLLPEMAAGLTVSSVMKHHRFSFVMTVAMGLCLAQTAVAQDERLEIKPPEEIIIPEAVPAPPSESEEADIITEEPAPEIDKPDYSHLTPKAERQARLDEIFERLQAEDNPEDANLIAEEVWALWLDSGSASINFVLRRGSAAHKRKDHKLARRMFDHVTALSPEYAEGWARSSRLALDEKDLSRALNEAAQALVLEPRHFYALWTMGNIFEQLGRQDEALEAYREANKLYPELKAVKDRLEAMQSAIDGDVL